MSKIMFASSPQSDRPASRSTRAEPIHYSPEKARETLLLPHESHECFYCHKRDQVIADCLSLKRKQQGPSTSQQKNICLTETVQMLATKRSKDMNDKPNPCFTPFISKSYVSLTGCLKDFKEITVITHKHTPTEHQNTDRDWDRHGLWQ